jgi:hypothetical protein
VVTARARHDVVAAAEAVLPHEMRRDVGVTRLGEVAVGGATNEAAIARWIEPPLRLAIGDDRGRRLLLLVIALAPTAAVTAVPSPVAIELLVLWATTIVAARFTLVALVAWVPVAMFAVLSLRGLIGGSGGARLGRFPRFGR